MNTRKSNQELINSKEYRLKSPPTQNLKLPPFLLQNHSSFRSVLAKISVIKQVKSRFFYPFTPWGLSVFKPRTCILHHLAFLVWLPAHYFLRPTTHFQPLKTHFLTTISPFSAMFFMVRKGFIYTIAMYFYAFHLAFSTILPCIQHHFTLRFAAKCTAFSTKLHCVLQQNALHLAAKRTLFCWKWPKNWYKQHSFEINIHFVCMYNYTFFASKQTFARIDFLRQVGDWWTKKALRMLNFLLKIRQKNDCHIYTRRGSGMGNTYTYKRQGERLQGMQDDFV